MFNFGSTLVKFVEFVEFSDIKQFNSKEIRSPPCLNFSKINGSLINGYCADF